jgi:hypothetical protein
MDLKAPHLPPRLMTVRLLGYCLLLALTLGLSAPASAKGETVRLSVTGPGLDGPLILTDRESIGPSIWGGDFVAWDRGRAPTPSSRATRYQVQFFVKPSSREGVRMMYVVNYVWDPETREALVYLPGAGDKWYRLNSSAIMREGQDGGWYHAAPSWGDALRDALHLPADRI